MISQQEAFWDKQRESLNRLRQQIIDQATQRRKSVGSRFDGPRSQSKPSSAEIGRRRSDTETDIVKEIIPRVVDHAEQRLRQKAKSTTPPPRNLPRMTSPNDRLTKNGHQRNVRGSKYTVVPPLKPKKAFPRPRQVPSSDDSWGESESDSSDEFLPYVQYPYPYVMPPPVYAPPPLFYQARYRPRRKKCKHDKHDSKPSYVLRPTHDQATHTVHEQSTQWQDIRRPREHRQPRETRDTGVSPALSRDVSRVSRGGGTQRSRGHGRTPRDPAARTARDIPVQIFVTPASRASGTPSRASVPQTEDAPMAPPIPPRNAPGQHPPVITREDVDEENGYVGYYEDESIYSGSHPEVPPRLAMPKYYYYYTAQRPRYNRDLFDQRTNSVLRRYKYYYETDPNRYEAIDERYSEELSDLPYDLQILRMMLDDEKFANSVVERLIDDFLYEDLIPDTLIDALSINSLPSFHPLFIPSQHVAEDVLLTEVVRMGRDIVREVVRELVDDYLYEQNKDRKDPLEEFLDNLFTEAIMEMLYDAAQEAVNEMAHEYIVEKAIRAVIMMMVNEIVEEDGFNLLDECVYEVMIDDFLDEMIFSDVIDGESRDLAHEVLNEYDTQIRRRAIKEIHRLGRDKLLESNLLDMLLTKIARDGKIWAEAEYMDKMLHGLILDITLREHGKIKDSRDATIENKALRKVHEKMVTDVALDVVLDELTQWLDEDLAELDERERGINVQDDCLPTEVNAWLYGEVEPLEPHSTPDVNSRNVRPGQKPPDRKRLSRFAVNTKVMV